MKSILIFSYTYVLYALKLLYVVNFMVERANAMVGKTNSKRSIWRQCGRTDRFLYKFNFAIDHNWWGSGRSGAFVTFPGWNLTIICSFFTCVIVYWSFELYNVYKLPIHQLFVIASLGSNNILHSNWSEWLQKGIILAFVLRQSLSINILYFCHNLAN